MTGIFRQMLVALLMFAPAAASAAPTGVEFPGPEPGTAHVDQRAATFSLSNRVISQSWTFADGHLRPTVIENRLAASSLPQAAHEVFRLTVEPPAGTANAMDAPPLPASDFTLATPPKIIHFRGDKKGSRVADRIGGDAIEAELTSPRGLRVHWRAELRDGSSYIHQSVSLTAGDSPLKLSGVEFADVAVPNAATIGTAPGCPATGDGLYFGVELPGASNTLSPDGVRIHFDCKLTLTAATPYEFGSVVGVAPPGQLRRAFLFYMERERARPSQPFLHYNDWYALGMNVSEAAITDVVSRFDTELVRKRGVPVLSYLVDDGWDDPIKTLWQENPARFPTGFHGLSEKLKADNTHMSLWISPLGGYSYADERTAHARTMGLIPPTGGLDLAEPGYKKWFQDRCLQLMREDGVNGFKWDRAGDGVSPHFMALLDIAHTLHRQNPAVFLNVTVGTWPSPFWLNHIDSTWRNGSADVGWAGKGDDREKWMTYRDGYCHKLFVEASPLYPLNSVMHHGIVHGRAYQGERVGKAGPHLRNDARAYFANGTMLQELYLTPSMMTDAAWDNVAEAAKWAHANADVLEDSHWVGGDPLKLEPYGYAAWNRRKGTLMLRNPDDTPRTITLDAATVFDLPANAPQHYRLASPYPDQHLQTLMLDAGQNATVTLQPFEVLVFDAYPK